MKKIILSLIIIISVGFFRIDATFATTKAVSTVKKVTTSKIVKKIENYAKRKHIKIITAAVLNSMNE